MAHLTPRNQADGPVSPARLKLVDSDLLDRWAREHGHVELAEGIDRVAVDADLVLDMSLEGFAGPVWTAFANELARYGLAVLGSWMATGVIYKQCAEKGRRIGSLGRPFSEEEIVDLANLTVAEAIAFFKDRVLKRHRWDPAKGASLRTYFIGQCVLRYPAVYRRFRTGLQNQSPLLRDDESAPDPAGPAWEQPEHRVITGAEAARHLKVVKNPKARTALLLTAEGWTQAEIAVHLNVSEKSVERMISYARHQVRQKAAA